MMSVIIPTCNRNDLLSICLSNLSYDKQRLTSADYEVIITDDSKNDGARDLIAKEFPWAKWIPGPKRGPAANRNYGAKLSSGEWLIFIDDDCIPSFDLLGIYHAEIKSGDNDALEGAVHTDRPKERFDEEAPENYTGGLFWSCNIGVSRKLFEKVKGFDEDFPYSAMEDIDFYQRIKQVNEVKIKFLPEALVVHPWRIMKPFASYKKHIASHTYFLKKNNTKKDLKFRFSMFKMFLGSTVYGFNELRKYSFKGYKFYLEKIYLNFILTFS